MAKLAVIAGTRPEAIKLAPVIREFALQPDMRAVICNTGQHGQLCGETLDCFGIRADITLEVMRENQGLAPLQARLMAELDNFLASANPSAVIVQGDTMSAFCGALTGFYRQIPVFHVEAGLRSGNLAEPFPEEALRQMLARIARLHFAPTEAAKAALLAEGADARAVHVTGNTVIDALFCLEDKALEKAGENLAKIADTSRPLVLVTVHRRENQGQRLKNILRAVSALGREYPDCCFILPVHPNPNVRGAVRQALCGQDNISLRNRLPIRSWFLS